MYIGRRERIIRRIYLICYKKNIEILLRCNSFAPDPRVQPPGVGQGRHPLSVYRYLTSTVDIEKMFRIPSETIEKSGEQDKGPTLATTRILTVYLRISLVQSLVLPQGYVQIYQGLLRVILSNAQDTKDTKCYPQERRQASSKQSCGQYTYIALFVLYLYLIA